MQQLWTKRLIRVTGVTLVVLMSLASARSLVPGLCATQAALDERCESASVCCERPSGPVDGQPVVRSASNTACAFCNLATTLVTATSVVVLERTDASAIPQEQTLESIVLVEAFDQMHAGRAPPAIFSV